MLARGSPRSREEKWRVRTRAKARARRSTRLRRRPGEDATASRQEQPARGRVPRAGRSGSTSRDSRDAIREPVIIKTIWVTGRRTALAVSAARVALSLHRLEAAELGDGDVGNDGGQTEQSRRGDAASARRARVAPSPRGRQGRTRSQRLGARSRRDPRADGGASGDAPPPRISQTSSRPQPEGRRRRSDRSRAGRRRRGCAAERS